MRSHRMNLAGRRIEPEAEAARHVFRSSTVGPPSLGTPRPQDHRHPSSRAKLHRIRSVPKIVIGDPAYWARTSIRARLLSVACTVTTETVPFKRILTA